MQMKINDKLRLLRQKNQLTQDMMAERLGMSINGYAQIERGESKLSTERLDYILQAFQINLLDFLSLGEDGKLYLLNEGQIYNGLNTYHGDDNSHFISGEPDQKLLAEIERLNMIVAAKDESIALLNKQLASLEEIIALLKKNTSDGVSDAEMIDK